MQIFRFDGSRLLTPEESESNCTEVAVIAAYSELDALHPDRAWQRFISSKPCTRLEVIDGTLYLSLNMMEESEAITALLGDGQLVILGAENSPFLRELSSRLGQGEGQPLPGTLRGLQQLMTLAADHHQSFLERTEEAVTALEALVMRNDHTINAASFITLRRRLLSLKRHTQPLEDLCDLLHENESRLLPAEAAGALAPVFRRCGRINAEIVNMENYVAQVRDAHQNHLDLRLNRSMMTLTVLAAIFLPLSLIVGWYGMNFPMPEFSWRWGYGYVIVLSVVCLAASIFYFRRKGML